MTTASQVARYLVNKGIETGKPLTNKRLQKLLYYVQSWHLAINGTPFFNDKIEAWIHGPAIRSIYEEYKSYSFNPINKLSSLDVSKELGEDAVMFIDRVMKAYSSYDTPTLEYMTHIEDPWQNARKGLEANQSSSNEITQEEMGAYYAARLSKAE